MQKPAKLNYKVYQGSTFNEIYRWESQTKVYVPIQNISKSAPCVITTQTSPDLPVGWRFRVVGAGGMREINSGVEDFYLATQVDSNANTLTVNSVNSLQYTAYTSGGVVEYNQPVDFSGYSARMQIRETVESVDIIHEATTANGQIILNPTYKTIEILIPPSVTQNFVFPTAVYSVELYTAANAVVIPFLVGNLTLVQEITR